MVHTTVASTLGGRKRRTTLLQCKIRN